METNKSWSIDDKRYNFQFGCEIAWEIRNGKRVPHAEEPQLQRHHHRVLELPARPSPAREHWTLWGVPNCGKGQPEQVMGTGGTAGAR